MIKHWSDMISETLQIKTQIKTLKDFKFLVSLLLCSTGPLPALLLFLQVLTTYTFVPSNYGTDLELALRAGIFCVKLKQLLYFGSSLERAQSVRPRDQTGVFREQVCSVYALRQRSSQVRHIIRRMLEFFFSGL